MTAAYAVEFRDRALAVLETDGVDVGDAAQVLLALRRTSMADLERRVDLAAPRTRSPSWSHGRPRTFERSPIG